MNVSLDDFISFNKRNDSTERLHRRIDGYRQRHYEMATMYDGRSSEVSEKQRQETAAFHKMWMESKSKRTTNKSKSCQKGEALSSALNINTKPKRKLNNDESPASRKIACTDENNVSYSYNYRNSTNVRPEKKSSKVEVTTNTGSGSGSTSEQQQQPFSDSLSLNICMDANTNNASREIKLTYSSSTASAPVPSFLEVGISGDDVCKKESVDDCQDANAVDDPPDLINFDDLPEGLSEFLTSIGQDGDFPPDILQVLNQSELESMDFHDTNLNTKDNVTECGHSLLPTSPLYMNPSSSNNFKTCNTPSSIGKQSPSSVIQMSNASEDAAAGPAVSQSLMNDAGPAAETLKQMAARCSQDKYRQKETYTYTMPHSVLEFPSSSSSSAAAAVVQYTHHLPTVNLDSAHLPALQSCLPSDQLFDQRTVFPSVSPINRTSSYSCSDSSSGFNWPITGKDLSREERGLFISSPSTSSRHAIVKSKIDGGGGGMYSFIQQNQQIKIQNQQQLNMFQGQNVALNNEQQTAMQQQQQQLQQLQQQNCYQNNINAKLVNAVNAMPYSDVDFRNMQSNQRCHQNHVARPSSHCLSTTMRMQASSCNQPYIDKNMMKMQSFMQQPNELHINNNNIKLETNMIGYNNQTNSQPSFNSSIGYNNRAAVTGGYINQSEMSSSALKSKINVSLYPQSGTSNNNNMLINERHWSQPKTSSSKSNTERSSISQFPSLCWDEFNVPESQNTTSTMQMMQRMPMRSWSYPASQISPQTFQETVVSPVHFGSDAGQMIVGQIRRNSVQVQSNVSRTPTEQLPIYQSNVFTSVGHHSANNKILLDYLSYSDGPVYDSLSNQNRDSLELSLIEDFINAVAAPETQRYKTTSATVNDLDLTTVYRDRNNPCPLSLELV